MRSGHTFTPKRTMDYEKKIIKNWKEQSGEKLPDDVPLRLVVICYFQIPKSYSKKKYQETIGKPKISRPDLDNLIKSAADALNGYAYTDDSRICSMKAEKRYGDKSYMRIIVEEMK